ncbi:25120_t:CDS:2, partial [Cetraspora pellucida]
NIETNNILKAFSSLPKGLEQNDMYEYKVTKTEYHELIKNVINNYQVPDIK